MSSPSINRWGLNLFWYRFWFVDKNLNSVVTQDDLINKLVLLYVHFGVNYDKNFFINSYWWKNCKNILKTYNSDFNLKYFRTVEFKNRLLNEVCYFQLRNKIKNIYFSKLWIFRYQNWLLINIYSYQPMKKKRNKVKIYKKQASFYSIKTNEKQIRVYNRLKFYLFFLYKNLLIESYYKF